MTIDKLIVVNSKLNQDIYGDPYLQIEFTITVNNEIYKNCYIDLYPYTFCNKFVVSWFRDEAYVCKGFPYVEEFYSIAENVVLELYEQVKPYIVEFFSKEEEKLRSAKLDCLG